MEAAATDAARMAVATGTAVTDPPITPESDAHSRSVMDDIVEISLLPTPSSFAGSPQSPPQARRSMRRASRTTRSSFAGSIAGESQGATQTRPDLPASPQEREREREVTASPIPLGQAQGRPSIYSRIRTFLGHGNPARRRIVHTIFSLTLYLSQVVVSAVFIALTQTKWRSHSANTKGGIGHLSEWHACDKPLGSMMIVWLVRCILGVLLTFWSFKRSVTIEQREAEERAARRRERRARRRATQQSVDVGTPTQPPVAQQGESAAQAPAQNDGNAADQPQQRPQTGWDKAYDRSISVTSLLAITHFLITNVLVFSSTKSCRVSSPHLWWSTFSMLCLTYIIILEVLIIGFTIFIIMPIIFIGLNILLIMTGHRPISARQIIDPGHINPETPKMPQKLVDKIPLVLYIPAPSPLVITTSTSAVDPNAEKDANDSSVAIPVLSADHPNISPPPSALLRDTSTSQQIPHSYPPDASETPLTPNAAPDAKLPQQSSPATGLPEATSLPRPHPRFAFFRRRKSKARSPAGTTGEGSETAVDGDSEGEWEDRYEKSSLPFVRLENNRATCAICLMDFDEPPRKSAKGKSASKVNTNQVGTGAEAAAGPSSEQPSTDPEPLRLLECGHVFHKSCLDPWLTGVSGRCPTCQRKVEIAPKGKRKGTPGSPALPV